MEEALDWRDGILTFNGDTLESVIAKMNQYSDTTIIIGDERLKSRPIGGYFKIGETRSLLDALTVMVGIREVQIDGHTVEIYGPDTPPE